MGKLAFTLTTFLLYTLATQYITVKDYNDLYVNTYYKDYSLAIMHNAATSPQTTKMVHKLIVEVENLPIIKEENVIVHMIYTDEVVFFDESYGLNGKNALMLFIRNQLARMDDFDELLKEDSINGSSVNSLTKKVEDFIKNSLLSISLEITDLDRFKEIIDEHKIVGLYTGQKTANFAKYLHVARKNLDFKFFHTFNEKLADDIFALYSTTRTSNNDNFAVIRHQDQLTEFDPNHIVSFNDLKEKALTEFIEFERYPKLRDTSYAAINTKKMFFKYQAILLFTYGSGKDTSSNFKIFKETVKMLDKDMIYAVMDPDEAEAVSYSQMFIMSQQMSNSDSLVIMYVTPTREVAIHNFSDMFTVNSIVKYVREFNDRQGMVFDYLREHLYDKEDGIDEASEVDIPSDEL